MKQNNIELINNNEQLTNYEQLNKNQQLKTCENSLNAKSVWGLFVTKLKQLNLITLYTACGEIRDVKFNKNNLVVNVKEDVLFDILTKEDNKNKIEALLKNIDDRIKIVFEKNSTKVDKSKQNLDRLISLFGKDLNTK